MKTLPVVNSAKLILLDDEDKAALLYFGPNAMTNVKQLSLANSK